jgi:hypothetical protein
VCADAGGAELVEVGDELGRQEHALAADEVGEPPSAVLELVDLSLQGLVDLGHGLGELLGSGIKQFVDPCERHTGVGEDLDADQVEHGVGVVAPVPRGVTRGLRQQAALLVVPYRAHGHANVLGELADGEHRRRGGVRVGRGPGHDARGRLKVARAPTYAASAMPIAPGDRDLRAVADRRAEQQSARRLDDRREGLVLGEPAHAGGHRVGGDEGAADEGQELDQQRRVARRLGVFETSPIRTASQVSANATRTSRPIAAIQASRPPVDRKPRSTATPIARAVLMAVWIMLPRTCPVSSEAREIAIVR